jgi:hypothetical protein
MNWRNIKYTIMQNHGAGQRNLDTKKKKKKRANNTLCHQNSRSSKVNKKTKPANTQEVVP